jgi:hypothetical protein
MAQLCANVGTAQRASQDSNKTAANLRIPVTASLYSKGRNSSRVWEEEEIHDDEASDNRQNDHPPHQRSFELQMHEISDDQR